MSENKKIKMVKKNPFLNSRVQLQKIYSDHDIGLSDKTPSLLLPFVAK